MWLKANVSIGSATLFLFSWSILNFSLDDFVLQLVCFFSRGKGSEARGERKKKRMHAPTLDFFFLRKKNENFKFLV